MDYTRICLTWVQSCKEQQQHNSSSSSNCNSNSNSNNKQHKHNHKHNNHNYNNHNSHNIHNNDKNAKKNKKNKKNKKSLRTISKGKNSNSNININYNHNQDRWSVNLIFRRVLWSTAFWDGSVHIRRGPENYVKLKMQQLLFTQGSSIMLPACCLWFRPYLAAYLASDSPHDEEDVAEFLMSFSEDSSCTLWLFNIAVENDPKK